MEKSGKCVMNFCGNHVKCTTEYMYHGSKIYEPTSWATKLHKQMREQTTIVLNGGKRVKIIQVTGVHMTGAHPAIIHLLLNM